MFYQPERRLVYVDSYLFISICIDLYCMLCFLTACYMLNVCFYMFTFVLILSCFILWVHLGFMDTRAWAHRRLFAAALGPAPKRPRGKLSEDEKLERAVARRLLTPAPFGRCPQSGCLAALRVLPPTVH